MSISPQSGARVFKKLPCFKYYDVLKRENRLTLELNADKNSDFQKKGLK